MPEYGMQTDGSFRRKTIEPIRESLREDVQQSLGNNVDLSPGTPHGQILDLATIELANAWEVLQAVWNASTFRGAYGIQLNRLLSLVGVGRLQVQSATGEVRFTRDVARDEDVPIPSGTRVSTQETESTPSIPFITTEQATISAGETTATQVPIRGLKEFELATENDEIIGEATNVASDTIQRIDDPLSGVDSVTNPLPTGESGTRGDGTSYEFRHGRDRETDAELKRRHQNSLGLSGNATVPAIRANLRNADPTVQAAHVETNRSPNDNTGSGGLPEKSVRGTVAGGNADAIAQTLEESVAAGIETYGSASGTAVRDNGQTVTHYYEPASEVTVYVDASVTHDSTLPSDGTGALKDRIISYIGGELTSGREVRGTTLGVDVIHSLVRNALMSHPAVWDATVAIDTSASPTATSDIPISDTELAQAALSTITLTLSEQEIP